MGRLEKILISVAVVDLISVSLSLTCTFSASYFFNVEATLGSWILSGGVPLIVATPVTWIIEQQRYRLHEALDQLESAHKKLEYQANRDYLTGVLNRRCFIENVSNAWMNNRNGVLLSIDADDFKSINDTYGHSAGDMALKEITSAISSAVQGCDLVGRIGGEEFAVYLADVSYEFASKIAERIRGAVEAVHFEPVEGVVHALSVSIGSAFVIEVKSFESLVNAADQRMYLAKKKGKNCAVLPSEEELSIAA